MRLLLTAALFLAPALAAQAQTETPAAKDKVVIEGVGLSREIPCDGQSIGIYGADNTIHLTGICANVVVHGDGHTVTVQQAQSLAVSGAEHVVTADSLEALSVDTTENTVTATIKSDTASATVLLNGADQTLNLTIASETTIDVAGTGQVVNWSVAPGIAEPRINISGIDNAVNRVDG